MKGLVAGRYRLLAIVGEGGTGIVYRAEDQHLDEIIALKMLHVGPAGARSLPESIRREVKLARRVTHENVARVYELGQHEGTYFLTMELIEGRSLQGMGPMSFEEAKPIVAGICAGLHAAHRAGVIHRDVKPENVLLGKEDRVVLTDFGIAREVLALSETSNRIIGTPAYMAPEQIDADDITPRTDLFALGVLLYELLTGELPWRGETALQTALARLTSPPPDPRPLVPDLDDRARETLLACLAVDPADRPATAEEVAAGFGTIAASGSSRSSAPIPNRTRVAVLPFSATPGLEHVSNALAQELIDGLGQAQAIRVLSRRMSAGLAGVPIGEAAAALSVERIVEGSITSAGEECRILVRLIEASTGEQLLTARIDTTLPAILSAADDLVRRLTDAMNLQPVPVVPSQEISAEAVDLYLRARGHHHRYSPNEAVSLYERAERMAPGHPLLLAALAVARARQAFTSTAPPPNALQRALSAAKVAVARAPDHGEPRYALGYVRLHMANPVGAVVALRQSIARSPSLAEALGMMGEILMEVGRVDEARRRIELALSLDETLTSPHWSLATRRALEGDLDGALEITRSVWDVRGRPWPLAVPIVRLLAWKRDFESIQQLLGSSKARDGFVDPLLLDASLRAIRGHAEPEHAYAALDRRLVARGLSYRSRALTLQVKAEVACLFDDVDVALDSIARSIDAGLFDISWADHCPLLESARAAPGWPTLRTRIEARAEGVIDAVWGDRHPTDVGL